MAEHEGGPQPKEVQEQAKAPEREHFSRDRMGLTARLILGPLALDPNKTNLPPFSHQSADTPNHLGMSIELVNRLSNKDRAEHWATQPEKDMESQVDRWVHQVKETLNRKIKSGSEDDIQKWKNFYKRVGFEGDITEESLRAFYNNYFTGDKKDLSLVRFIQDLIPQYPTTEGGLNIVALHGDKEKIAWFANIFGSNTRDIIPSIIEAQIFFFDNKSTVRDQFVRMANEQKNPNGPMRINELNQNEKNLLGLINAQLDETTVPPTPAKKKPEETKEEAPRGKDETEPKEKKPAIVIPKEQLDALKKRKITIGEKEITYDDLVNQIIDIQTGKAKSDPPSLAAENNRIIQEYAALEDTLNEEIAKNKTLIISPAAWAMMDAIAQRSHGLNKELEFMLHTNKTTKETQNTFLAQYAVPTNDFTEAQEKHTVTDMEFAKDNLAILSEKTELKPILDLQESFIIHTHQVPLGEKFIATPTPEDEAEITQGLEKKSPINWGILTKDTEGRLNLAVFSSNKDKQGRIHHNRVTVLSPDMKQLYKIPDNGFGKPWRPPTPKAA